MPAAGGGARTACSAWGAVDDGTGPGAEAGAYKYIDGKVYRLFRRSCGAATQYTWVPLVRDTKALAEQVYDKVVRQLPKPRPGFAPAADRGVVQLGTWFWTDATTWRPVSATAYVPGLSATVTATPTTLRFEPGDGALGSGAVTCAGPGPRWTAAAGDDGVSPCQYTYRHASSMSGSGRWPATVSIDWTVVFRASNGDRSDLGRLSTTAAQPLRVGEIQAVVVSP